MKKDQEVVDASFESRLIEHLKSGERLLGPNSPLSELMQSAINAVLEGELSAHLTSDKASGHKNKRNGSMKKRVLSNVGHLEVRTPRDRNSTFEPELIAKRQTQLSSGLDEEILALYAQGNSVEDVRRLLIKMFGVEIAAGKISAITDQVLPMVQAWRQRQLRQFYAVLYLDAIHFKVKQDGKYDTRAFYTVYGIDVEGNRDILGLYMNDHEGANYWGQVLQDLKSRGVQDLIVVCTDNLTGFSRAIDEVFPQAVVQKCIVHQVRHSVRFISDKERKGMCKDLRRIYTALNEAEARLVLESLYLEWPQKFHYILDDWTKKWEELMAFFQFPFEMRRMIYTTNPVEAVHRVMRKLLKSKPAWPSETSLFKQLYLSLMHNEKSWKRKAYKWKPIQAELCQVYGNRVAQYLQ